MSRSRPIAQLLILSAWLGAVLFFGAVVAPAAFAALPTRALAGAVVGRTLPALFATGMLVGLVVAVTSLVGRRSVGRAALGAALVMSCAISHLVIGARISSLRQDIGPSLDSLPSDDPRRTTFGRLHVLSVAGLGLGTLSATAALCLAMATLARGGQRTGV